MRFSLKNYNGEWLDLENLLSKENKGLINDFFAKKSSWVSAVLDQINKFDIYKNFVNRDMDIFLDIGAHIGLVALYVATIAKKIYCFEPSTDHFHVLKCLTANFDNIITIQAAISDRSGEEEFYESLINNTQNALIKHEPVRPLGKVKCYNLFNFLEENDIKNVDFVKIDVEGTEKDIILDESFEKLNGRLFRIYVEVHNTAPEPDNNFVFNQGLILRRLKELRYKCSINNDAIFAEWIKN